MHDLSLISTIATAFTAALLLGLITQRIGLSPIVGYLLAGVLIGPSTPGFVGDTALAGQLAEIGVILLMFGVGLHFQLKELLAVKGVAIPGAIGQSLIATVVTIALFAAFGVPPKTGIVIGMAISVASTVVLMRVLTDANLLESHSGHMAVGWLIVEDIFTVIVLVLIPVLGDASEGIHEATVAEVSMVGRTVGLALLKLGALVAIVLLAGSRIVPWALLRVARLRSRELFTLTVLVIAITIAAGSYFFFGASMALGAFLAGMVVAQSPVSHQAAADALPMRDAFAVLFFVSVGMLFDPAFLVQQPLMVAAALGIILLVKPLAAIVIVAALGQSASTALTVALGLAQIGEFSFILSDLARDHGLMSDDGHNLLVASAILSITLNPLLFRSLPKIEAWINRHPPLWRLLNSRAERRAAATNAQSAERIAAVEPEVKTAIVVGYGPVGRSVQRLLQEAGIVTVVIDMNMDTIMALNAAGEAAIFGNAAHGSILMQAGIRRASHLIVTLPQPSDRAAVVSTARTLNPSLRILVRARYLRERENLEQAGATAAVFEEAEAAVALARLVLADTGHHREAAERKINDLRLQLITENLSNIGAQRVRSVMVPWVRVRWLSVTAERNEVLEQVSQERFSRWPVVDPRTGQSVGYLLTKDLVAHAAEEDWARHVRPLKTIRQENTVESALARMQSEHDSVYLVEGDQGPVGLITREDILEQVVGQIEDEYPHEPIVSLREAIATGGVDLELSADSRDELIRRMARLIPPARLPAEVGAEDIARLALAREEQVSTDLGNGVAIPHARCTGLAAPLIVVGRLRAGVHFTAESAEPVRLAFLIVTPASHPEAQLALLGQLARVCQDTAKREELMHATWAAELLDVLDSNLPADAE